MINVGISIVHYIQNFEGQRLSLYCHRVIVKLMLITNLL